MRNAADYSIVQALGTWLMTGVVLCVSGQILAQKQTPQKTPAENQEEINFYFAMYYIWVVEGCFSLVHRIYDLWLN